MTNIGSSQGQHSRVGTVFTIYRLEPDISECSIQGIHYTHLLHIACVTENICPPVQWHTINNTVQELLWHCTNVFNASFVLTFAFNSCMKSSSVRINSRHHHAINLCKNNYINDLRIRFRLIICLQSKKKMHMPPICRSKYKNIPVIISLTTHNYKTIAYYKRALILIYLTYHYTVGNGTIL